MNDYLILCEAPSQFISTVIKKLPDSITNCHDALFIIVRRAGVIISALSFSCVEPCCYFPDLDNTLLLQSNIFKRVTLLLAHNS